MNPCFDLDEQIFITSPQIERQVIVSFTSGVSVVKTTEGLGAWADASAIYTGPRPS